MLKLFRKTFDWFEGSIYAVGLLPALNASCSSRQPALILFYPFSVARRWCLHFLFRYRIYRWYQYVRNIELGIDEYDLGQ